MIPEEYQQKVIEKIKFMYQYGATLQEIATRLNNDGDNKTLNIGNKDQRNFYSEP